MKKPFIIISGVEYKTKKSACDAYGISLAAVNYRVDILGMPIDKAITTPMMRKRREVKSPVCKTHRSSVVGVVCDGIEYESISSFARALGAPKSHVHMLLGKGESPEKIAEKYRRKDIDGSVEKVGKTIKSMGKSYCSVMRFADHLGVSHLEVRRLLRDGLSPDEIEYRCQLKQKFGIGRFTSEVVVNGVVYPNKTVACRDNGVSKTSVNTKMRLGMTFEEAINSITSCIRYPVDVKSHRLVCDGKYCLVECAVCGKFVMLPIELAYSFKHSDDCEANEWEIRG